MTSNITLGFGSLKVAVASDRAEHLEWLVEFLTPHFRVLTGVEPACRVLLSCDQRRFTEFETLDTNEEQVAAFGYDSRVVYLPLLDDPRHRVAFDRTQGVFYSVRRETKEIEIVAGGSGRAPREPLMKVVRELAMLSVRAEASLVLHASACAVGGAGVIIVGPRRSGKTSLLTFALTSAGARYVANDRVVVRLQKTGPELHGMPTIVALRSSMLGLFPALRERLTASGFQSRRTLAEAAEQFPTPGPAPDGRYGLSPAQFCVLASARPVAGSPATAIFFPKISVGAAAMQVKPIPAADGARRLAASLFGGALNDMPDGLFELEPSPLPPQGVLVDRCNALAERLPCFDVLLGPESYGDPDSIDILKRALIHDVCR